MERIITDFDERRYIHLRDIVPDSEGQIILVQDEEDDSLIGSVIYDREADIFIMQTFYEYDIVDDFEELLVGYPNYKFILKTI